MGLLASSGLSGLGVSVPHVKSPDSCANAHRNVVPTTFSFMSCPNFVYVQFERTTCRHRNKTMSLCAKGPFLFKDFARAGRERAASFLATVKSPSLPGQVGGGGTSQRTQGNWCYRSGPTIVTRQIGMDSNPSWQPA